MTKGQEKFDKVMHEWKEGKLHSSSGELVKHPSMQKQALAIAYSEARQVDSDYGLAKGGDVMTKSSKGRIKQAEEYVNIVSFYISEYAWHLTEDWDRILWLYNLKSDSDVGIFASEIKNLPSEDLDFLIDSVLEFLEEHDLDFEDLKSKYDKFIYREGEIKFYDKGGKTRYDNGGVMSERDKMVEKIENMKKQLADPKTVPMVKKSIETLLPVWEKKLANWKEPIVESKPVVKPVVEVSKSEVIKEVEEKIEKKEEEKPKEKVQVVSKKEGEVKAHIEGTIEGEFEGTIETKGEKPIKIKEKVSVEVESKPTPKTTPTPVSSSKPQRNISIPGNMPYWVDIEDKFRDTMRSATGAKKINKKTKTVGNKYRIYVATQDILDQVVNMYNLKRTKAKLPPVSASSVSGKHAKGGKLRSASEVKKEESLRNKAKRMGLIKNKQHLSENDLKKVGQQSPKWKKVVESYKVSIKKQK